MRDTFGWRVAATALVLSMVLALSLRPARAEFKVGLVLDRGGKDDKSFNASAYEGATQAKKRRCGRSRRNSRKSISPLWTPK